jgi:hypothetical protein
MFLPEVERRDYDRFLSEVKRRSGRGSAGVA